MLFSFNDDSLNRHNVTHREALETLGDPFKVEVDTGNHNGNPTAIWVGKTLTERLLEVGVEYLEDCNHIYHAAKARTIYATKYSKRQ
jgi:glucose-6-phosphate 1-dehydrogenase